jgi:hypothetical protein
MKYLRFNLILIFAFTFFGLSAQDTAKSNASTFTTKSGSLISKEFIEVGSLIGVKVKLIKIVDLISKESIKALRLELENTSGYSTSSKIVSLDIDEVSALISSIIIIQEKVIINEPPNYTEVTFKSREGFEAGCFWSKNKWSNYIKLDRYDSKSYVFIGF